ncbi:hypothetical protein [Thiomicrorhabdus sediminis]|uniref:Uncharacterized protein n=1 Tax=Thiomicrorhabdus sediminis TaxID=2580412 RepID=A0A4P9K6L9_9GAMM|nr:hypothetical protein [Thiomicrorhabdus sediminis]QCU90100.1 hypothetical protein FE785_05375 [Thiomicrorhabdus sediminis]
MGKNEFSHLSDHELHLSYDPIVIEMIKLEQQRRENHRKYKTDKFSNRISVISLVIAIFSLMIALLTLMYKD